MCSTTLPAGRKTLAIIGNGFDLAHGYHTDYRAFVENTKSPLLDEFQAMCREEDRLESWYQFEESIRVLTEILFQKSYAENCDYDENRKKVARLRELFTGISRLLLAYLAKETAKKEVTKLPAVADYLRPDTCAVNFNYTKIASAYTDHVLYVHGSLEENRILLGYDERQEPCLAQYEDISFSKPICRERLAYQRFLHNHCRLSEEDAKYQRLMQGLEDYQHWRNSGRGLAEEADSFLPEFRFVDDFFRTCQCDVPEIDYDSFTTLVILGHGIEADQNYLKKMVSRCKNLAEAVFFRYRGEPEASIQRKMRFFETDRLKCRQAYYF